MHTLRKLCVLYYMPGESKAVACIECLIKKKKIEVLLLISTCVLYALSD